ncbi:exopolyphosphatase/guanosine-5'-triphosphate,3'-diphosphate pyrophosphatase [Hydrogenivirga caldilitoris]|uniref:Exopolyphosphatase/guanosine-5'-triphosphate, 3'-diphosphate pyrophosphatase n=1 Tax=Hydrogenivirga caldilitoris TaxID=246264 RepID=A0A497XPT4_9AQUI|nr:Ppx/GppA phosphatase family protein [Hydrogenivirga caldilitoris]RLJ70119.1 exopolyphosphatase/guanosine-5'-triphosphate,3'-diphosphate pyrophosphatase [Hydrogenivirga caldilitoris]
MRIATIDIGSYSVRLTVAELVNGQINLIREKGYITSLGSGVKDTGRLQRDRIEETIRVLEEYSKEIKELGVDKVVAVATEALRRAKNSEDFIKLVRDRTGIDIRVISPQEEGELSFLATAYSLKPEGEFLVVDQGGGSTEFIFGKGRELKDIISLPIGIVSLTEDFLKHDPPTEEEINRLMAFLEREITPLRREVNEVVGLGGTITTVAALEKDIYPYDPKKIHGTELTLEALKRWFNTLASIPYKERSVRYKQIEDKRAEVILPGIAMFIKVLEVFGKDKLRVGDWGVKHGLIVKEMLSSNS